MVSFLSQVPDPQGQPALNFVMTQWCTRHVSLLPISSYISVILVLFYTQPSFFGVYEMRVSSLALTKILTHCVGTNDERLTKITVDGEEVMVHTEGIQTRSKRAAGTDSLIDCLFSSLHSSLLSLLPPLHSFSLLPPLLSPPSVPHQWTKVPLPVKLLKLLISDIQSAIEVQTAGQEEEEEEQGSDEVSGGSAHVN